MKWTRYATGRDREMLKNGTVRTGEKWADAGNGMWIVPDDDREHLAFVRRVPGADVYYEIDGYAPRERKTQLGPKARAELEKLAGDMDPLFSTDEVRKS